MLERKGLFSFLVPMLVSSLFFFFAFFPVNASAQANSLELMANILTNSSDVAISKNLAYVAGEGKLYVMDISNPRNPIIIGELAVPNCSFIAVDVFGGLSYATQAAYFCRPQTSLYIVDITDPQNPVEIGKADLGTTLGAGTEVDVEGNYAYITHAHGGFIIVDISDPQNPELIKIYSAGADFRDVKVVGNLAYLAETSGYLWIVDVTDPRNPVTLSTFQPDAGNAFGVDIVGNLVYTAQGSRGLRIIDVSDPRNPREVGFYDDPIPNTGNSMDVEVEGNYAFVADGDFSLKVIDVSDPTHPFLVDQVETEGLEVRVTVSGNYIYDSTVTGGLYIFKFGEGEEVPTPFLDLPWDYEGRTFREAVLSINSYFDHEYPLLSAGVNIIEPSTANTNIVSYLGFPRTN